jgi:hypothetical protein
VVRVPGYTRCIVFPVRYELNLYMLCRRKSGLYPTPGILNTRKTDRLGNCICLSSGERRGSTTLYTVGYTSSEHFRKFLDLLLSKKKKKLLFVRNKNPSVRNYVCVTFILARVVLSLLHVWAHVGHLQVSRIQKC